MITVLGAQREEQYERTPEEAHLDDVQILFEGRFGPKSIGHYICIHYRANEQKVYVYDSLYSKKISQRSSNIIEKRFQSVKVEFVRPRTLQPDGCSCGVFAAAYATTIILGENPAEYSLFLGNDRNRNT